MQKRNLLLSTAMQRTFHTQAVKPIVPYPDVPRAADAVTLPEWRAQLAAPGIDVMTSTPAQFAAHIHAKTERWANVTRSNGIQVE